MLPGVVGRAFFLAPLVIGLGCTPVAAPKGPSSDGGPSKDYSNSRYTQIRDLLERSPDADDRAVRLYPLVAPVCKDEKERAELLAAARWSVSFSTKENALPTTLALDLLEHVATTCFRHDPAVAEAILAGAHEFLPDEAIRFSLIRARFLATSGQLELARAAAQKAVEHGSVHGRALLAAIEAQRARGAVIGYRPGMYEAALEAVNAEPDASWAVIDLTAVLSTRARLLSERSMWEEVEAAKATRRLAQPVYQRLSVQPFVEVIRTRALDVLCFDSVERGDDRAACKAAAEQFGILGAAALAKVPATGPTFDEERKKKLTELEAQIAALPAGSTILVATRGDEGELVEWARAASVLLAHLAKGKELILIDRTTTPRASAVVARIFELAQVTPKLTIAAKSDTLVMPCVTAILASRATPTACPIPVADQKELAKRAKKFGIGVLIGRDLDAEIDDLKLYNLPALLVSFRRSQMEKGLAAWMKSLSDVWLYADAAP